MESGGHGGFLPPEPSGPEPDLGGAASGGQPPRPRPPADQTAPTAEQPSPQQAEGGSWAPPSGGQPPVGAQPPPPGWQPPPWGYQPSSQEPDNGAAVAGFVTSVVSAALLLMSFGFLGVLTLIAAPFGIHYSRKGKAAVAEGRTRKHAGLAQAGFVIGLVTLVLSILAVAIGIAFIVALVTDDQFRRDLENNPGFDSTSATVGLAILQAAARLVA